MEGFVGVSFFAPNKNIKINPNTTKKMNEDCEQWLSSGSFKVEC